MTFVDHRVSVNFGCPSVIADKDERLVGQEDEIFPGSQVPAAPADHDAFVGLNHETGVSHEIFAAIADSLETLFGPDRPTSTWQAFSAGLDFVQAAIEMKTSDEANLLSWATDPNSVLEFEANAVVQPLENMRNAASQVRMRFGATLMRDALPKEVNLNMSLWRRVASLPKIMPLVKLSGVYFSKVQQREIDIDKVAKHALPGGIEPQATVLLKRCFRTRIWQRFLIGTRLSVVAGLHQHIHDLNCILFLARADAFYNDQSHLTYQVVADNLSRFEFNFANQPRLFGNASASWFNNQLNDLDMARASLRMMAMAESMMPLETPSEGSRTPGKAVDAVTPVITFDLGNDLPSAGSDRIV